MKNKRPIPIILGTAQLGQRLRHLIRQPVFLFVTVWGHTLVLGGTVSFHYFEKESNPKIDSLFDSLFWAIGTVSGVGGSDIVPVTFHGKIVAMLVMIFGSLFLWSYAALFVGALVSPEIRMVEDEVREFSEVERKIRWDQKRTESVLSKIETLLEERRSS